MKKAKTLDIITVLMKNDRVREFEWLDTRSPEEDRYAKQIKKDKKVKQSGKYAEKRTFKKNSSCNEQ